MERHWPSKEEVLTAEEQGLQRPRVHLSFNTTANIISRTSKMASCIKATCHQLWYPVPPTLTPCVQSLCYMWWKKKPVPKSCPLTSTQTLDMLIPPHIHTPMIHFQTVLKINASWSHCTLYNQAQTTVKQYCDLWVLEAGRFTCIQRLAGFLLMVGYTWSLSTWWQEIKEFNIKFCHIARHEWQTNWAF